MQALNAFSEDSNLPDRTFRQLPGKSVMVIGDVILDEYVTGEVKRISPEAPVPVVEFGSRWYLAGGAANVAANIVALGCRAVLGGIVGADPAAGNLRSVLHKAGVGSDGLLTDTDRPTTVKLRILAQNQQIVRLDHEVRRFLTVELEEMLLAWFADRLKGTDVCVLSDYGKGVLTPGLVPRLIARCREACVPVLVDPKSLTVEMLAGATLVKPNKHEAERLANCSIHDDASFLEAGRRLARSLPDSAVLITRGALGMTLFRHDAEPLPVANAARNVYDVTGAGDTVIATLAAALAGRASVEESICLASVAASVAVEQLGTATVTADQLKARWRG